MLEAVFFDLDGTLLDTERLYVEAVATLMARYGHPLPAEESLAIVYGRSWRDVYADLRARFPDAIPAIQRLEQELRDELERMKASRDLRISGSIDLLRRVAASTPVAVVSGSTRFDIEHHLGLAGIRDHVRFWVGAEDYPRGKPDPAPYRLAAERQGARPEACLVFEDSRAGVRSAKAAGMRCVGLARPEAPRQDLSEADLVLADLGGFDLATFLERALGERTTRGGETTP